MKTFEELIQEETKQSNLPIPMSIKNDIKDFQKVYRELNGVRITREHVVVKLMAYGMKNLKSEQTKMEKEISKKQ